MVWLAIALILVGGVFLWRLATSPQDGQDDKKSLVTHLIDPKSKLTLKPNTANEAERIASEKFSRLWEPSRELGRSLGFTARSGSHEVELYLEENATSSVKRVFVSAYKPERFLFRATPWSEKDIDGVLRALTTQASRLAMKTKVAIAEGDVNVECRLEEVLGAKPLPAAEAAARLLAFVEPLLRGIPERTQSG